MVKKYLKKVLIGFSLVSIVAITAPMVLTSCSDKINDNKSINLGSFNNMLNRTKVDSQNAFKLNAYDLHGDACGLMVDDNGKISNSEIKDFYKSLIQNKITTIDSLLNKGFNIQNPIPTTSKTSIDYNLMDKIVLTKKSFSVNDLNAFNEIFKGLYVTSSDYINSDYDNIGVINRSSSIDFLELLQKTNVELKIIIIDRKSNNLPKSQYEYYVEFKFTPKDNYYWNKINEADSQIPLIISLKQNITYIDVFNNLEYLTATELNSSNYEVELKGKISFNNCTTVDEIVNEVKTILGLKVFSVNSNYTQTINLLDDTKYVNLSDKFNFLNFINKFYIFDQNSQWTNIKVQNAINACNKDRINALLLVPFNNNRDPIINLKIQFNIKNGFDWFCNFKNDVFKRNPTIIYDLTISNI